MTKEEYGDFVLRYKGCGACFSMYHTLSRFEKMWFDAIQKDVAELEKENRQLKNIKDVADLLRLNNDTVVTMCQLNNELVSANQLINKLKKCDNCKENTTINPYCIDCENHNKWELSK